MNNSGDAAEQVLRMSLEGAEFALKITGHGGKEYRRHALHRSDGSEENQRESQSGNHARDKRPMTIYTVKKEDCPEFARQAKRYGIKYAPIPIKKKNTHTIDITVFEDDASRRQPHCGEIRADGCEHRLHQERD